MKTTFIVLLFLFFLRCGSVPEKKVMTTSLNKRNYNKRAIKLNNQAIDQYMGIAFDKLDTTKVLQIIDLFDKAIKLDTTYYLAYGNKAEFLARIGRYDDAIKTLDQVINIYPKYKEGITMIGLLFDKLKQNKRAKEYYKKALSVYNAKIDQYPDSVSLSINKIFIQFLMGNDSLATNSLDKLSVKYPKNENIKLFKEIYGNFDKKTFIAKLYH